MTILSVAQQVSSVIGVMRPQALFPNAGSDRTARELADLAIEMAQRIAYDTRDWQALVKQATFFGDYVPLPGAVPLTAVFALPANYKRMLITSNVWRSTSYGQPMNFIPDADEWLQRRLHGYSNAWGEWTILGNSMHIFPPLNGPITGPPFVAVQTASFNYLDKNCVNIWSGGRGDVFTDDRDTFALDERLLKLGMIWQWKANKGSPYAEDMANYETAMDNARGADKPAPVIIGAGYRTHQYVTGVPYAGGW